MACFEGGAVPEECLEDDCLVVEMCSLEQIEGLGEELLRARTDLVRALEVVEDTSSVNYRGNLEAELQTVDEALAKLKISVGVPFDKSACPVVPPAAAAVAPPLPSHTPSHLPPQQKCRTTLPRCERRVGC
jgi:hypothetical protein